MDGFEECGIRWLTAASIDAYRDNPAFWVMRHLYGVKPVGTASLARVIAVKEALRHWLYKGDIGQAEDVVDDVFRMKCAEFGIALDAPDARSEHSSLLALFLLLVNDFREMGLGFEAGHVPLAHDLAHSVWVDGLEAPFLVAPAFVFENSWVEVKPGKRCYNSVQPRDMIRCALNFQVYKDKLGVVMYATAKRSNPIAVPAFTTIQFWTELVSDALALQNFIRMVPSREQALAVLPTNPTHFRWDARSLTAALTALQQEKLNAISRAEAASLRAAGAGDTSGHLLSDLGSWDDGDDL